MQFHNLLITKEEITPDKIIECIDDPRIILEALSALHEMYFAAIEVHRNEDSKAVNISDEHYEYLSHNYSVIHHLLVGVGYCSQDL